MSAASIRERIAEARRRRRVAQRELNRLGTVLVRLAAHRDRLVRGATATGDLPEGDAETTAAVKRAVGRLVEPGTGETVADRRKTLGFLEDRLLAAPSAEPSDDTVSFFRRASAFQTTHSVAKPVRQFVAKLKGFIEGSTTAEEVKTAFEGFIDGSPTPTSIEHVHTLIGFATTAARLELARHTDRLNDEYEGDDLVETGLLADYLEAVGEDPLEVLDEQPVVLLPVRLETRFVEVATDDKDGPHELRVRIYPDQVHLDVHEPELTDEEVRWGRTFWAYLWYASHANPPGEAPESVLDLGVIAALDDDSFSADWADRYVEIKERAWRQVVERFGRERAAFVVHTLRPTSGAEDMLGAGDAGEAPWGSGAGDPPGLTFPSVPRRPEEWTAQPRARLLPDRWVAHATWRLDADEPDADDEESGSVRQVSVAGRPVKEPLAMGPDPETLGTMADEATGETGATVDGERPGVPPGLEWLVDYEAAQRAGMAITLTADDLGFDPAEGSVETLVVVGVKTSMSGDETVDALRELLDAHHYGDGLEFLEPGTPSNNADVPSAYASADDPVGAMSVELGAPLVEPGDYGDGDRVARALGLWPDEGESHVFAHVRGADRSTDREARHMNNALWPATIGYTLKHLLVDNRWGPDPSLWSDTDDIEPEGVPEDRAAAMREGLALLAAYRRHFVKYVRGGGPFPALRIGAQPYGVLPVAPRTSEAGSDVLFDAKRLLAAEAVEGIDTSSVTATDYGSFDALGNADWSADTETGTTDGNAGTARTRSAISGGTALTDGAGRFVPRYLPRRDDEVVGSLSTWLDRFTGAWREVVHADAAPSPTDGDPPEDDGPRPLPRTSSGMTLVDVLAMEATAGDYLRKAVFTDALTIWEMVMATDDDFTDADLRRLVGEADADLTDEELEELLEGFEPPSGRSGHWTRLGRLHTELIAARERQRQDIRETLQRYDLTGLDPRVAHFLYEDALAGDRSWRTIQRLVDDDVGINIWLLQQLPYRDLRRMGYREGTDGAPETTARQKQALMEEQRTRFPGTEPVRQKSLLRVLLRFATMQEFVNGRLSLGAIYDDPVSLGPDPIRSPDVAYPTWFGQLQYHWIPTALAQHPELTGGAVDDFEHGSYLDALEYLRQPGAVQSPIPAFGDFTYSLNRLGSLAPSRLETLLTQTLDVASHRLDAWWTSIATRRLFELRAAQGTWVDRHRTAPLTVMPTWGLALSTAEADTDPDGAAERRDPTTVDEITTVDSTDDGIMIDEPGFDIDAISSVDASTTELTASTGPLDDEGSIDDGGTDGAEVGTGVTGEGLTQHGDTAVHGTHGTDAIDDGPFGAGDARPWLDEHVELVPDGSTVYVGGYGFVEDLEPDPETGDTEFIHAPSVQQARTAALLRSGHQSHEGDDLGDALAIDLSADRVRLAAGLLEGVRNGQSLGALLGYRFERALHEAELQRHIPAFRQLAPGLMGRLEHGGEDEAAPAEPGSTAAKSDVVDGYRLYQRYQEGDVIEAHPDLPWEESYIFQEALSQPIDALNDLLTAESVHQLAQGNIERASGSVDALVDGRVPQPAEVVETPRSRTGITHRQLVLFDAPTSGDSPAVPDAWNPATPVAAGVTPDHAEPLPMQVRPLGEPALNAWIAELFPDPESVSCRAVFRWDDPADGEREIEATATLADLELSPLDVVYLTQDVDRAGTSQLEGRLGYHLIRNRHDDVPTDAELELQFTNPAADDDLSLAAFLELARAVRDLVLDGRSADGEDLSHPADGLGPGYEPTEASVDPAAQLGDRLAELSDALEALDTALDDRIRALDRPAENPTLLDRIDAVTEAVTSFAETTVPGVGVPGTSERPPTPAQRFDVFEQMTTATVERLRSGASGTAGTSWGGGLLTELDRLTAQLPAGPMTPEDAGEIPTVESAVDAALTGHIDRASSPTSIDLEAWSLSPVASFHTVVEGVSVDEKGRFATTVDFEGLPAGTPIQVVGRANGSIVYSAPARVVGGGPTPSDLEAVLATDRSTVGLLLRLAHVRSRLSTVDGTGSALDTALTSLIGADDPTLAEEIALIERLVAADVAALEPADVQAIHDLESLVEDVDLESIAELEPLLGAIDRLGLTDLVTVSISDGDPTFSRGSDRSAGVVRTRLAATARDRTVLLDDGPHQLLGIDPTVAQFIDDAVGDDAAGFVTALEAFLQAPQGMLVTVDDTLDDIGTLSYHLALLLYHPDRFTDEAEPTVFTGRLQVLADAVGGLATLDDVIDSDVGDPESFGLDLQSFLDGTGGIDLETFIRTADWRSEGGDAAFATHFDHALERASSTTGTFATIERSLESIRRVLDAPAPARSFRAGVYETVRHRLLWASYFGVYGSVPDSVIGGDPADESGLVGQLRSTAEQVSARHEALRRASDTPLRELGVPGLVDRIESVFGDSFVVMAPFVTPNAPELERAFAPDRLGDDPLAAETWLQRAAHVRDRPRAFREATTYAETATGELHRNLTVGQLPDTDPGPWIGRDGVEPEPGQVSLVVQRANELRLTTGDDASSFAGGLAGLFVDEWVEPVPSANQATGIALNYDDPGARAPQAILVATPPTSGDWAEPHLRTAVAETLGLAKLRLVDLEGLAATDRVQALQHLLPALWFPRVFEDEPLDPSVDFEALERFDPGADPEDWQAWIDGYGSYIGLGGIGFTPDEGSGDGESPASERDGGGEP